MFVPILPIIFPRREAPAAKPLRPYKPVLSPPAQANASELRIGREFSIGGKRNKGKVFIVQNILPNGFQYGEKVGDKTKDNTFMSFKDAGRIILL
jgi:hypothetical protein